jgi:hypothetical protein
MIVVDRDKDEAARKGNDEAEDALVMRKVTPAMRAAR